MAGCVFLTELVRGDVARDLVFTGRIVKGEAAVSLGLATRTSDDPLAAAMAYAQQVASANPHAIRAAKRLLNAASPVDAAGVLKIEAAEQQRLIERYASQRATP
jgi:enoyl-CoA hydratase/carnithine racemase